MDNFVLVPDGTRTYEEFRDVYLQKNSGASESKVRAKYEHLMYVMFGVTTRSRTSSGTGGASYSHSSLTSPFKTFKSTLIAARDPTRTFSPKRFSGKTPKQIASIIAQGAWGPVRSFTNNGFVPEPNPEGGHLDLSRVPECNLPSWMNQILEKLPGKYNSKLADFQFNPVLLEPSTRTYVLGVCYVQDEEFSKMNHIISRLHHPILDRFKLNLNFFQVTEYDEVPEYSFRTPPNDYVQRTVERRIRKNFKMLDAFIDNPQYVISMISWYIPGNSENHARLLVKHLPDETIYVLDPHGKMYEPEAEVDTRFIQTLHDYMNRKPGRKYKHIRFYEHVMDQSPHEASCVAICFLRAFYMLYNITVKPGSFVMDYVNMPIPCIFATFVSRLFHLLKIITNETYEQTKRDQLQNFKYKFTTGYVRGKNSAGPEFPIGAGISESTTFVPGNDEIFIRMPIDDAFELFDPKAPLVEDMQRLDRTSVLPLTLTITSLSPREGLHSGIAETDTDYGGFVMKRNSLHLLNAYLQGYRDIVLKLEYRPKYAKPLTHPFIVTELNPFGPYNSKRLHFSHPQEQNSDYWYTYTPGLNTIPKPVPLPEGLSQTNRMSRTEPALVRVPIDIAVHLIPNITSTRFVKQDIEEAVPAAIIPLGMYFASTKQQWTPLPINNIENQLQLLKTYMSGFTDVLLQLKKSPFSGEGDVELHELVINEEVRFSLTS